MKLHYTPSKLGRLAFAALAAIGIAAGAGVASANTNSLATPRVLEVKAASASSIAFSWQDRELRETHYAVTLYGMSVEGWADGVIREMKAPAVPGQGGKGEMTIRDLLPDTGYCVAVRAIAGTGPAAEDSHSSNEMCTRTPKAGAPGHQIPGPRLPANAPPATPKNLRAAFSRGIVPGIEVEWNDVQGETSYYLIATNLLTGIGRPIATDLPANTTLFLDQDAIFEEGTILYELRACNDFGCSDAAFVEVK
jgi:hypothetical protein